MHEAVTALLLVDLQVAFCDADGSMASQGRDIAQMAHAARACNELASIARSASVPVIWTKMQFAPDYSDGGLLIHRIRPNLKRVGALRRGDRDAEISSVLTIEQADIVIEKPRYSALYGTSLEVQLRSRRVGRIVVAGVTTSMCVDTTVRDLGQRDFDVLVVRDGCADFAADRHEAALAAMEFGFARVVSLAAARDALEGRFDD